MAKLTIIAHITANPNKIEEVKASLLKIVDVTRAEEGCIDYDLHQDNENPTHFMFYENWESRELWQVHWKKNMSGPKIEDQPEEERTIESFTIHEMTPIG